ncbi:hypothetical protein [Sphingobium yanoikuyae]|uniref:hypothetical protein n=1 Tax=Sphingobium yanoikuyae TaxID=13690 RepID=UPI0012DA3F7D|nr:hypothetical protein [Sphingobium yanoikuyae]
MKAKDKVKKAADDGRFGLKQAAQFGLFVARFWKPITAAVGILAPTIALMMGKLQPVADAISAVPVM